MFRCVVSGMMMEDNYEEKTFDGKTTTERVTRLYQEGIREILLVKAIPESLTFVRGDIVQVPCVATFWSQGGRYGASLKYDTEVA